MESLASACAHAVINDNSGASDGPNGSIIASCRFCVEGRLTLAHTTFADFSSARNVCIDATPPQFRDGWGLRIDCDEVFDDSIGALAAALASIPAGVDVIDGYSRHFVGSFGYYDEIARQLLLFRLDRGFRWRLPVHEQLIGAITRVATPALLYHYGHVVPPAVEERRGQLYSSLGQPAHEGTDTTSDLTVSSMWGRLLRRAIRYAGNHPSAAHQTLGALAAEWSSDFREADAIVARQSPIDRARNALRAANYGRLLWWRTAQARMRWGWR